MKRYILPTTDWASLVPIIVQDAQPGSVLEVHTEAMAALVRRALEAAVCPAADALPLFSGPPSPEQTATLCLAKCRSSSRGSRTYQALTTRTSGNGIRRLSRRWNEGSARSID